MEEYQILAKPRQLARYNQGNLLRPETQLVDIAMQADSIDGAELMALMGEPLPVDERVNDWGAPFTAAMYQECCRRIPQFRPKEEIVVQKGVAVDNAPVRCFPTMMGNYCHGQQGELDRFAKSMLKLGEGVLVYCSDSSNTWFFVRSRQVFGWVLQEDIAIADEQHWHQYMDEQNFVQLLSSRHWLRFTGFNGCTAQQLVLMGTHLVLHDAGYHHFLVSLPQRSAKGRLVMLQTIIPRNGLYYPGYLPLTIQHLRSQGSGMLGEPYDWGCKYGYRDCTALVSDLYGVFGVYFASNSRMQMAQLGVKEIPAPCTIAERKALLDDLLPGTVLYMPGHAMVYLGREQREYRILHSVYQIGLETREGVLSHKVKRVMEGHLEQLRTNGQTFLHDLTAYWEPGIISCI